MTFKNGSKVWVEDNNDWIDGEIIDFDGILSVVLTSEMNKIKVERDRLFSRDTNEDLVDDMANLAYLNEPSVLYNLKRRYTFNDIYTYTGKILIAVNPFTKLPHMYDERIMRHYKDIGFGVLCPHIFYVAQCSYRAMINEQRSQSILVSGESGAGKTETTKLIMQYLTFVGGRASIVDRSVEQQVLESNPLLEAFGNAKTARNDNSSRFGKFVEIQFNTSGSICGAAIRTYLLERSRVVQIRNDERNFHCFYQLCANEECVKKYKLGDPSTFHYLNQSRTYELEGSSNSDEFLKTKRAMNIIGLNVSEQEAIFQTLAAILHLGNIEFAPSKDCESASIEDPKSLFHLKMASDFFMCDSELLVKTLISRSIDTPQGIIVKALNCQAALANRDALAKTVYSQLFYSLVENINRSIGQDEGSKLQIGILDIYGFECFTNNSFEQFCINYANEKLQQHFNEHVFKMEQEEYNNEEINWSYIEFIDNQDVIDLIEKKPIGIISLLDEACALPKSTHETFCTQLFKNFLSHKKLEKTNFSNTNFTLSHYAGKVTYQTEAFLVKNRDYFILEHLKLLSSSQCPFISGLFASVPKESCGSSYKLSSVSARFREQLKALMEKLKTTEPHYIRCVKPNSQNLPQIFENQSVLHQLRCGGVLEAVRISLAGYPSRITYFDFVDRFRILVLDHIMTKSISNYDEKTITKAILEKLNLDNFQLGLSKIFLRKGQMEILDMKRSEVLDNSAKLIQSFFRTIITRKEFLLTRETSVYLQAFCRARLARRIYENKRRAVAAVIIQKNFRGCNKRRAFRQMCSSVLLIQAAWRRRMKIKINAVVSLQCAWRKKIAKKELRVLKAVAPNEAASLHDVKTELESKVEDELESKVEDELESKVEEYRQKYELERKLREDLAEEVAKLQCSLDVALKNLEATKKTMEKGPLVIVESEPDSFPHRPASLPQRISCTDLSKEEREWVRHCCFMCKSIFPNVVIVPCHLVVCHKDLVEKNYFCKYCFQYHLTEGDSDVPGYLIEVPDYLEEVSVERAIELGYDKACKDNLRYLETLKIAPKILFALPGFPGAEEEYQADTDPRKD